MKKLISKFYNIAKEKAFEFIKFSGVAFLISFLGAYAGSEGTSKDYRRIGIPLVFLICAIFAIPCEWWVCTIITQNGAFRLGHGIPEKYGPEESIAKMYMEKPDFRKPDAGSRFGRIFFKLCKGNNFWTNFCTRGFIAFLLCIGFIGVPIVKGNWLNYILCNLGIILTFAMVAWRNLGQYEFNFKGKTVYLCTSDVICFGILGLAGMKIIF